MDPALSLPLPVEALRSLVADAVAQTLAALEAERAKLAYPEHEAAELVSLKPEQLADERRRGRVGASVVAGGRYRYTRADLAAYLALKRVEATAQPETGRTRARRPWRSRESE